jgi:hypothetical protein
MARFLSSGLEENDMAIPYYHVDAFTDELFAGNPAGASAFALFTGLPVKWFFSPVNGALPCLA